MKRNASKRDERHGRSRHRLNQSFGVSEVNLATLKVVTMKHCFWLQKLCPSGCLCFFVFLKISVTACDVCRMWPYVCKSVRPK